MPEETPELSLNSFMSAMDSDEGVDATPITPEETIEQPQEEIIEEQAVTPEVEPQKEEKPSYNFDGIVFEEPTKPESKIDHYLKLWGFEDIEAVRQNSPGVAEILEELEKVTQDKYNIELDTFKLKTAPEIKEALITNQVVSYINDNTKDWASEFVSDVLSKEQVKQFNSLNKTKAQEVQKYIDELIPEYVFKRKLDNKTVYNPFIFYKTEIINKINEVANTTKQPQNTNKPAPQTIADRKAVASISNAGTTPVNNQSNQPISGVFAKFKALGI